MKTKLLLFIVLATSIISCHTNKKNTNENKEVDPKIAFETVTDSNKVSIENIEWILTTLGGEEVHKLNDIDQNIHFILNSDSNRVRGFLGCNTFVGTYIIENGNHIKFSNLVRGKKACPVAAIDEVELFNVFEMAENFTINNGNLTLNTKKIKSLAEFKKTERPNEPIVEKYWKLKTLDGKDISMINNQKSEIYFTLKIQDNRVHGFTGCNNLSGEYMLEEGNRIRFKNIGVTLKACPDLKVNETDFLKVFELVDNYTIKDNVLSLNIGRRAPLAVFEAVYMQ